MNKKNRLSYKKAGVDIDAGDRFVDLISPVARRTFRPGVAADIGAFGAFFKLNGRKYKSPVLVSGTDGVGTKLKVAFMVNRHDTVGIDLVAMSVNDILTAGAEPLFFLDYFATGRLKPGKAAEVIKGIAAGCIESGCALIGGETAEMPGFYARGEYDLAGFAVGVVERDSIIDGRSIRQGDAVIGAVSSGLHSNGYSLARKVFFDLHGMGIRRYLPELGSTLGEELLKPTRIYVKAFNVVKRKIKIKGMAHITGGGIPENLPRIIPRGLCATVFQDSWPAPAIFRIIKELGNVADKDMKRTFNMGIGYIFIVGDRDKERTVSLLKDHGFDAYLIGKIDKGGEGVRYA
ncbi:MAG: phosphoribosylformylglycinamidine cyclo-ligase [Nitrospiraceae bacterium]|nr:phosphoribosylformylglycinamidine cyclo-ligase [Nitrospiraceae bacterium]